MPSEGDVLGNGGMAGQLQSLLPTLMMLTTTQQAHNGTASSAGGSTPQWVQLLLTLLLPIFLQSALPKIHAAMQKASSMMRSEATRMISHTRDPGRWWRQDKDDDEAFNAVIQRAILKYINTELPDVAKGWQQSNVQVGRGGNPMPPLFGDHGCRYYTSRHSNQNQSENTVCENERCIDLSLSAEVACSPWLMSRILGTPTPPVCL